MKELEFSEGELPDLQSIADRLFADVNDPTSASYRRTLVRPRVSWLLILMAWLIPLVVSVGVVVLLKNLGVEKVWCVAAAAGIWIGYGLLRAKAAAICLIQIYQRYAPSSIRCKCRFEPSCSVYMMQAIEKYGLVRGLRKGTGRLLRCKPGYGGFEPLD